MVEGVQQGPVLVGTFFSSVTGCVYQRDGKRATVFSKVQASKVHLACTQSSPR